MALAMTSALVPIDTTGGQLLGDGEACRAWLATPARMRRACVLGAFPPACPSRAPERPLSGPHRRPRCPTFAALLARADGRGGDP